MAFSVMNDNSQNISSRTDANALSAFSLTQDYVVKGVGNEFSATKAGLKVYVKSGQASSQGRFIFSNVEQKITVPANSSGYIVIHIDLGKPAGEEAGLAYTETPVIGDLRNFEAVHDIVLYSYISVSESMMPLVDLRKWPTAPGTRAGSLSSGVLTAGVVKNITIPIYPSFPLGTKVIPTLAIAGQNPQTFAMGIVEVTHSELKISVRNEVYSTGATIYWTATAAH